MNVRIALSALLAAAAFGLTACGGSAAGSGISTPALEAAYDKCAQDDREDTLTLGDEGHTVTIDTESEYGDPIPYVCMLVELKTPDVLISQMESTTSLMGMQEEEADGYTYTWAYHPDNGINMIITDA